MSNNREALKLEILNKAVVHGKVILSSGKEADYYVDLRRVTLDSVAAPLVGDVMLDHFVWGNVRRISPEAPVPVVEVHKETSSLGGAGNVAANLAALGAQTALAAVIGADERGQLLTRLLEQRGVRCDECAARGDDQDGTTAGGVPLLV